MRWQPFREMDRFFDEDFAPALYGSAARLGFDMSVDVYEKDGNVVAEMSVPGIDPEKVDIAVEDNYLRVAGSREEEKEDKNKNYYSKEIRRGSFERTVRLPAEVNGDAAKAEYKDGVLRITLPKVEEKKAKKVKVEVTK